VTFDTEDFDTDGYADLGTSNIRLTVPANLGGLFLVGGTVQLTGANALEALMMIRKNDTANIAQQMNEVSSTALGQRMSAVGLDLAIATDFYQMNVYTEGGADVVHNTSSPRLWIVRLGQAPA